MQKKKKGIMVCFRPEHKKELSMLLKAGFLHRWERWVDQYKPNKSGFKLPYDFLEMANFY